MKLEKLKTAILFCLVVISVVLTTRIWLDISIPGIFIMPGNNEIKGDSGEYEFDNTSLIKPEKMIINDNGKHTIIYNDSERSSVYNRILEESRVVLEYILSAKEVLPYNVLPLDTLNKLRSGSNVEMTFPLSYDFKFIADLLGINKPEWYEIKKVDSIILSNDGNQFYLLDREHGNIYEFMFTETRANIKFLTDIINKSKSNSFVFLNDVDSSRYGENVFIPIYSTPFELPKLSAKSEIWDSNSQRIAADFFDIEVSSLRSIVEPNGTVIYSDGAEKGMKIEKSGLIEFASYSDSIKPQKSLLSEKDYVNIGADFINLRLGFPTDAYISSIEKIKEDNYVIKFNYRFEGLPIINDDFDLDSPIEIEIEEGKVKRFKRIIRHIKKTEEMKNIMNPLEIIDILYKRLYDKNIKTDDIFITDVYLSYFEYGHGDELYMLPVWVIDVDTKEKNEGKYIMNAESGVILSEPY